MLLGAIIPECIVALLYVYVVVRSHGCILVTVMSLSGLVE